MKSFIKKIYRFIFAPPFDGFGPLISTMVLIWLCQCLAEHTISKNAYWIGLISYPLLVWFNKKCYEVLGLKRD